MMFPGQGTQKKGMGGELFKQYPDLEQLASDILGTSVKTLCLQDPEGKLSQTRYTQPALFVVNAMHYMASQHGRPDDEPTVFLGHSLGEYNALVAAGMLTFSEGLQLVCARAQAMSNITGGSMSAVIGLTEEAVQWAISAEALHALDIANVNTPHQIVIAGPIDDLRAAEGPLIDAGAKLVKPLEVSGPFHSRHMSPARHALTPVLDSMKFEQTHHRVISNTTARAYTAQTAAVLLAMQIDSAVRWAQSIYPYLFRNDVRIVEMGGNTLSRMNAQIIRNLELQGISATKEGQR